MKDASAAKKEEQVWEPEKVLGTGQAMTAYNFIFDKFGVDLFSSQMKTHEKKERKNFSGSHPRS